MKVRNKVCKWAIILLTGLLSMSCLLNTNSSNRTAKILEEGFLNPPDVAKPRIWWHWMSGNITKEGIRADLEWMKRSGIGGFHNFNVGLETPQVVDNRLMYMTPEWKDAMLFTTKLADSLGFEMAIASSPGWSETGGKWVKPHEAMKKYVWSETVIEGGKSFSGILSKPFTVSGPFQNIKIASKSDEPVPEYYADVVVVAWRLPVNDILLSELQPVVTSNGGAFTLTQLTDGDLANSSLLPFSEKENSWIQFEFPEAVTMQALSIVGGGTQRDQRYLEAGNDGNEFFKVIDIPQSRFAQKTLSFQPTTAKYFRFVWKKLPFTPTPRQILLGETQEPVGVRVAELILYGDARINMFEEKAAFTTSMDLYDAFTPVISLDDALKKSEVIDITDKMSEDGTLNWTPPVGKWKVLRLGYSLTGEMNRASAPDATGLEVDKLNAEHVRSYLTHYLDLYKDATQGLMGKRGIHYLITDSWEVGTQNWTEQIFTEFKKRRGYDMISWLPALSGRIVESAEASDKFLWDFRKTLSDLLAENHYDQMTALLKERGMGRYSESHEGSRVLIADGMDVKRKAYIPMSAFWIPNAYHPSGSSTEFATAAQADIRESASTAHLYGQNLVAAESFTVRGSEWACPPSLLKPYADHAMSCGLNRFVIHTSVHQPLQDKLPGLSLGPYGQWLTRNETWAEQAIAWTTYLARSCYMLQQGKYVADIAYYYGEDNNITSLFSLRPNGGGLPKIPKEYSYDFVNTDALVHLMKVDKGQIVPPSGMRYRVLALDYNSRYMTLRTVRKIREMVEKGAVVCGVQPVQTPSLADDPEEFDAIVHQLWAKEGANQTGKGTVYAGTSLAEVLKLQNIAPDFSYVKPQDDANLFFVHRQIDDMHIYWVANRNDRVEDIEATFRVNGMEPEIWRSVTGSIEKASYSIEDGVTKTHLHLESLEAVFVVFRYKTNIKSFSLPVINKIPLASIEGEWNIAFQAGRGAPAHTVFPSLIQWNEHNDKGIKYFSGTAVYSKTIQAPVGWFSSDTQLWLDLGDVQNFAEVAVNGESLGIVWTKPFRVNVTGALKQGDNYLEIKVTNLWVNRLIGDRQPNAEQFTFTTLKPYSADSPLKPSGLLGPVTISKIF